jgi:A/G-specific adenine glycosylase
MSEFARRVIDWQRVHGRHDLPWQGTEDPYRIWLSEVMLQQTQVATVIPYFLRFVERFPGVGELARAPLDPVLELWSGLGYYSRARNLHAAARLVQSRFGGRFPTDSASLQELPGVGRSSAAAIAVFSAGERAAILDGNVRRVFCRHDAIAGHPTQAVVLQQLWQTAEHRLPGVGVRAYTQGLMDLGATVCTRARPDCERCPLAGSCRARALGTPTGFPAPRPRRELAVRELAPLVILDGDRVLLERRPDKGIWGGLWSLPECPVAPARAADALAHARAVLGEFAATLDPLAPVALPEFAHLLTHFRLKISPWLISGSASRISEPVSGLPPDGEQRVIASVCDAAPHRWLSLASCGSAALPQPIKRLLLELTGAARTPDTLRASGSDDLPLFQELTDQ